MSSRLLIVIHERFQIASAVQHLNNQNDLFVGVITIEDHVLWKTRNENPTQTRESRRAKMASCSALWTTQQRIHRLIDRQFPSMD